MARPEAESIRAQKEAFDSKLTVREKIFKAQYENTFNKKGPELELFFHELTDKETVGKKVFNYVFAIISLPFLILLFPFIALGIKLTSRGPVVNKIKTTGRSGIEFTRYEFRITHQPESPKEGYFGFGNLLLRSGLYKLPTIINIFKREMSAVGPMAYSRRESIIWNNTFDDFYKRYSVDPGMIAIYFLSEEDQQAPLIKRQLKKEFTYIVSPGLRKDLRILFGKS